MSNQIVATPPEFIAAVEKRFGRITWDLAANASNDVTKEGRFFGPGSLHCENAFLAQWNNLGDHAFLNPTFENFDQWASKMASQHNKWRSQRMSLLGPASVCTNYFNEFIRPNAYVFELTPRIFKEEIRDCTLALFEPAGYVGRELWQWKGD